MATGAQTTEPVTGLVTGPGLYFDGTSSERHDVTVEAAPDMLRMFDANGLLLAQWPYAELRAQSAPAKLMRLSRAHGRELARLEIRDPVLMARIDDYADSLDRSGVTERRLRRHVIGWTIMAAVSLVLVGVWGLPALSGRIAPLIPLSAEQRLGAAMDQQVRSMLDSGRTDRPFECGTADAEKAGRAGLPIPLRAATVRKADANAIALPGGHIYVFEGLIRQARTPDELAGVIAHEIGHVAHRDGTRSLLQAAGLSFLFGMLLGDFTGGGLVVIAARTVVQSAYSRDVENAADLYGVGLMTRAHGDPRALAAILERIAGGSEPESKILLDHPKTKDRVVAINAAANASPGTIEPLLPAADWAALKRICG